MGARHWVGGTATWDATAGSKWALTNGGAGGQAVPTAADDVFFNSGSAAAVVTLANGVSLCRSIDCTGFTGTIIHPAGCDFAVGDGTAGVYKLAAGMTYTLGDPATSLTTFKSTTTGNALTFAGKTLGNVTFNGVGGAWTFQDAFVAGVTATITLTAGTLDTNGKAISTGLFVYSGATTRVLTLGASIITLTGTGTVWSGATVTGLTLSAASSTLLVTDVSSSTKTLACGTSKTFGSLTVTPAGTGAVILTGTTGITFSGTVTLTGAKTVTFPQSVTTTIGTLVATGSSGNVLTLNSGSAGTQATISCANNLSSDYLAITDITFTGGGVWRIGGNSTATADTVGLSFAPKVEGLTCLIFDEEDTQAIGCKFHVKSMAWLSDTSPKDIASADVMELKNGVQGTPASLGASGVGESVIRKVATAAGDGIPLTACDFIVIDPICETLDGGVLYLYGERK